MYLHVIAKLNSCLIFILLLNFAFYAEKQPIISIKNPGLYGSGFFERSYAELIKLRLFLQIPQLQVLLLPLSSLLECTGGVGVADCGGCRCGDEY